MSLTHALATSVASALAAALISASPTPALAGAAQTTAADPTQPSHYLGSVPTVEKFDWGNDPTCVPTPEHPNPVVLVPGTWAGAHDMAPLGTYLQGHGYCVYSLTYGIDNRSISGKAMDIKGTITSHPAGGLGDMHASADQLHDFVHNVATNTDAGAASGNVDIVAHSQGGAITRMMLNKYGAKEVSHVVTLSGTNHGTMELGVSALQPNRDPLLRTAGNNILGTAPMQQVTDSDVVAHLNSIPDTEPGVDYTVLATETDIASTPPRASYLTAGPGATVRNVMIQDVCPVGLYYSHDDMRDKAPSHELVDNALSGRAVQCTS